MRVSRGSTASPAAAATSTAGSTGKPAVKSPAACQTYSSDVEPAAGRDARVEAAGEDEVGEPERDPEHGDRAERPDRLAQPVAPGDDDEGALRGEHERPVGMRRDGGQDRERPQRPRPPPAAVERAQEREVRERARERKRLYIRP